MLCDDSMIDFGFTFQDIGHFQYQQTYKKISKSQFSKAPWKSACKGV